MKGFLNKVNGSKTPTNVSSTATSKSVEGKPMPLVPSSDTLPTTGAAPKGKERR
jgi:hypothetical protein